MDEKRREILSQLSCNSAAIEQILNYNQNNFPDYDVGRLDELPPGDELQMAIWREYIADAEKIGAFESLKKRLVQLCFPVKEGMATEEYYRAATLKGVKVDSIPEATGLKLNAPDQLKLFMHCTAAGAIPVIIVPDRCDFVSLIQALSSRNEPIRIPDSMGASMVVGLNNWDRIERLKSEWQNDNSDDFMGMGWSCEFKRITQNKELYQDKFIILSSSPYSGVEASELGLTEERWSELSLIIRREHECCHYMTNRLLGTMRNCLHDELIADYMGITAAIGEFRSDWFLRFLGLENYPDYRVGGRLENYCRDVELSDEAFKLLQAIAVKASQNLEAIDLRARDLFEKDPGARTKLAILLTQYSLEELTTDSTRDMICNQILD